MMTVQMTCPGCGSSVHIHPHKEATRADCDICHHEISVQFNEKHEQGILEECPCCTRKDFYTQKDFNRKLGVILFVIAAILSIWTYGMSLVALWLIDLFLFRRLKPIVICYKCQTVFRQVKNARAIPGFDHEMNDRIVYADHDFQGKPLSH